MSWRIEKQRLGKAGGKKERLKRQRSWDKRYGEGQWDIGYIIDGAFVSQTVALENVYDKSYEIFFDEHPEVFETLIATARVLRNPHAEATTGVDLQVPSIQRILKKRGRVLNGRMVLDIGTWKNNGSHPLSVRLSPLHIKCAVHHKLTLEKWWQTKKCLVVWRSDEADLR